MLGFEDCHFAAPDDEQSGLGAQLSYADKLEAVAGRYTNYPYRACYDLGRSCTQLIDADFANVLVEQAFELCRFEYPDLNVSTFEAWLPQRESFNQCMAGELRRQADDIRISIMGTDTQQDLNSVLTSLGGADGASLKGDQIEALTQDTTWCPRESDEVGTAILCRGGGMVVATGQGEQRLQFRVDATGALCFSDFLAPESCHGVVHNSGTFSLQPSRTEVPERFSVVTGVRTGDWQTTCN